MVVEKKLGRTIKSLRMKHKMSQVQLARKVGTHYQTVGHWERGNQIPRQQQLLALKSIFRLSDNEYDVLTMGIVPKRTIDKADRIQAHIDRIQALDEIGNTPLAELDDNDPRLLKLKMAVGEL